MKLSFLPYAEAELDEAIVYLESEQAELGERFRREIIKSLNRIIDYPEAYALLRSRLRRCLLKGFPYGIIYQYKPKQDEILVIAIAHLHRKPDYWISRPH